MLLDKAEAIRYGVALPIVTAHFESYEDLSSRLVLLPFNDDDCTGAKICSHKALESSVDTKAATETGEEKSSSSKDSDSIENITGDATSGTAPSVKHGSGGKIEDATENGNANTAGKRKKKNKKKRKKKQAESSDTATNEDNYVDDASKDVAYQNSVNGQSACYNQNSEPRATTDADDSYSRNSSATATEFIPINSSDRRNESREQPKVSDTKPIEEAIPVGHVLVMLVGKVACMEHKVDDLEGREFTEILSLLRDVAYPITLTFASAESLPKGKDETDETNDSKLLNADDHNEIIHASNENTEEIGETPSKEDDVMNNHSIMASREEAAKYAAQAASELRGRLSRWGFQAVTKATEAAHAVQEIREERRKVAEEQVKHDIDEEKKCETTSTGNDEEEAKTDDEQGHCRLFLQAATGFIQLNKCSGQQGSPISSYLFSPQKTSVAVTNMSVITVRLSEEDPCPIGKNGYKFQWFRSYDEYSPNNTSSIEWIRLNGANYPTYQPSVSDIGYVLSCSIDFGDERPGQRCTLPVKVTADISLFESAKTSLLKEGRENRATFNSLKDSAGNVFRLKIFVETKRDAESITKSSFLIEPMILEPQSLSGVKARSDPSCPRGFEMMLPTSADWIGSLSSSYRLKLEAPNRITRESLLITLALASFTGSLSSISTETTLLPFSDEIEMPTAPSEDTESQPNSDEPCPTLKNLYSIQLEAQVKEMHADLEAKSSLISKLQDKINASNDDKKRLERELMQARSKADELAQCMQDVDERDRKINEQERTIKSLTNEKAVMSASIEMRDRKLSAQSEQIGDLKTNLADALRQIEEMRKNEAEQIKATREAEREKEDLETAAVIAEMKREEAQFQQELKAAQSIIEELNQKYASTKDSATKSKDELERIRTESKKLKMERNTFKNKADSLTKELSKLQIKLARKPPSAPAQSSNESNEAEIKTLASTIKQLQLRNSQLQDEVTSLRSEKRDMQEELRATRMAHEQSAKYLTAQQPITPNRDAQRAFQKYEELENIISNLTDDLDAKKMQIHTLKLINETLLKEIDDAN